MSNKSNRAVKAADGQFRLIQTGSSEPRVSTIDIARGVGLTNRALVKQIEKRETEFSELGEVAFEMLADTANKGSKARPQKLALLNEPQATFLLTLSKNTPAVVGFKLRLTKEFDRLRKQAEQRATLEWQSEREQTKLTRKTFTDELKVLVDYAFANGSTGASHYYTNATQFINKLVFGEHHPGIRDSAPIDQLQLINLAEQMFLNVLRAGVKRGDHYKDIYDDAKKRTSAAFMHLSFPLLTEGSANDSH